MNERVKDCFHHGNAVVSKAWTGSVFDPSAVAPSPMQQNAANGNLNMHNDCFFLQITELLIRNLRKDILLPCEEGSRLHLVRRLLSPSFSRHYFYGFSADTAALVTFCENESVSFGATRGSLWQEGMEEALRLTSARVDHVQPLPLCRGSPPCPRRRRSMSQ